MVLPLHAHKNLEVGLCAFFFGSWEVVLGVEGACFAGWLAALSSKGLELVAKQAWSLGVALWGYIHSQSFRSQRVVVSSKRSTGWMGAVHAQEV